MLKRVPFFIEDKLNELAKAIASGKMGDILIITSAAGWLASSAAQILGIAFNKNYSKEQKKFMIAQESADALTNIGLYCAITKSCTWISSKLVSTGRLTNKKIFNFLKETSNNSRIGDYGFDITKVSGFKQKIKPEYDSFKNVADATAAIAGGVLSSNILTPFIRNEVASYRQNKYINNQLRKNKELDCTKIKITRPIKTNRHTFEDFKRTSLSI